MNRRRAFTLIEIVILTLIIGILAAIAVPNFIQARTSSQKSTCIANLHAIEAAKEQWAMDTTASATATPTQTDLVGTATTGYLKSFPTCAAGGSYTIGNMSTRPVCSKSSLGHVLP